MSTLYTGRNNPIEHQLEYSRPGSGAKQYFNLATATEIIVQFMQGSKIITSFTDATHNGITVKDELKGIVEFQPDAADFTNPTSYKRIDGMRWIVKTTQYPDGVVFGEPNAPVKITE